MPADLLTDARTAARRRVAGIRNALAVADSLLAEAYAARDWEALGHASWRAYCAAELPELAHLKLRAEPRRARIAALLAAGEPSVRDLVAATGAGVATVAADLEALRPDGVPAATVPVTVRVLTVLAAADRPLTFADVVRRAKLPRHSVVPALSRLARSGRIVYESPAKRGMVGHYRVP